MDAQQQLFGLMAVAEEHQKAVKAAIDGLMAERAALTKERAALTQAAASVAGVAGDVRKAAGEAVDASVKRSLAGAADAAATALGEAAKPIIGSLSGVVRAAGEAEGRLSGAALQAPAYRLRLEGSRPRQATFDLGKPGESAAGDAFVYAAAEVEGAIAELRRHNAAGYDVHVTPLDAAHHYLVIDGMKAGAAQALKDDGFVPCLVLSSEAGREQAVLKVAKSDGGRTSRRWRTS